MVDLNVVAVDGHGQPVTDLKREELVVSDSGKPQAITFFHHRDSGLAQPPKLAPGEVSNRGGNNIPRATLVLFDLLNERFATRGVAANQIIRELGALESADYLYFYMLTVNGQLFPVHGLPGAQESARPPGGVPWTRQIKPIMDQALRAVQQMREPDIDVAVRVDLTYRALNAIAVQLSRVPGRKSLVWITDGVPIALGPNRSDTGEPVDFTPLLRQMSEGFDRSGVAIYPVRMVMIGSADSMGGPGTTGAGSLDTLDQFAGMTGGRPDAGKDIGGAVRQAISDMGTSYQVGYTPAEKNWDNKFHKLRVTSTRKGIRIQSKTGYFAWKEAPGARSEQAIDTAISTSFDAAEIGLRAKLSVDREHGNLARIEAHIDAQDVALVRDGEQYRGELRLALAAYTQGARPEGGRTIPLELHYSAAEREKAIEEGIPFAQNLKLGEGTRAVRLIVYDRGLNTVGSITVPVAQ